MQLRPLRSLAIPCGLLFVAVWWLFAYWQMAPQTSSYKELSVSPLTSREEKYFSPFSREEIQKALNGDFPLLINLALQWDEEAQQLKKAGFTDIKTLSDESVQKLKDGFSSPSNKKKSLRILPQTYTSASFVLALSPPEQIAAIPKDMRRQEQLYLPSITSQVPDNIESFGSEKIFLLKPEIAFVAEYSNPTIIHTLQKQKIPIFKLLNIESLEDVHQALADVGMLIGEETKAEILQIFMGSALNAMENRLAFLGSSRPCRILYLNYLGKFYTPTPKSLLGKLFPRLKINADLEVSQRNQEFWRTAITHEQIHQYNPSHLIMAVLSSEVTVKHKILQDPALSRIPAIQNQKLFFVDEMTQESNSQYIVLAYYDLYAALREIYLSEEV